MAAAVALALVTWTSPVLEGPNLVIEPKLEAAESTYSAWSYNAWKTFTYQAGASLDGFIFGAWFGNGAVGGLAFGGGNLLLATPLYYAHEMLWNRFGPDPNTTDPVRLGVIKVLTYRVISTTRVLTTGYLLTGSPLLAGGYAVANNVIEAMVYFVNDLAWARFGPPVDYLGAKPAQPMDDTRVYPYMVAFILYRTDNSKTL
jgi:uncharacterized membrane protein